MYYMLLYDYVDDIVERRQAVRPEHLALAQEYLERGVLVMGGAWADPLDGAVLIFRTDDRSDVEAFVDRDPYVRTGLVTSWWIREWTVVIGGESR